MYKNSLILITGGHATPAIACIEELQSRGFSRIVYVGQKKSLLFDKNVSSEYRLITEKIKIPFKNLVAGKLSLFLDFNSLIWVLRLPIGFVQSFFYLIMLRPKLILTFGGHLGVPICFWGSILKIPIIAHEQTTTIGRANRLIQKFANKVCISWGSNIADFDISHKKFILTGNPIRKGIFHVSTNNFIFKYEKRKTLFITGGNQGAHSLNEFIFANLAKLTAKYNVIHQTGSNTLFNDYQKALQIEKRLNYDGVVYIPRDYIFVEEMAEAYAKADIVISRSGANTITELLALKKKAVLIPIPTTSGNEQFKNAKLFEELGLGKTINQEDLNFSNLTNSVESLLYRSKPKMSEIERLSSLHINAAKTIVDIVENL